MLIGYMRVSSGDERQSVALQRDALLAATQSGRGRLKVFLGMSPGVGKTFEMLRAARRRAGCADAGRGGAIAVAPG